MTQLLKARLSALQDAILTQIEHGAETIEAQLKYWEQNRKLYALLHVARKQGITKIGHQPVPTLQVSEAQAKQAIEMHILLSSLQNSPYANEKWTMAETSAELVLNTEPTRTFKKGGFSVTVFYDNDEQNANEYPAWKYIYALSNDETWQKHKSKVSHDGIYYVDAEGVEVFYTWFGPDASRYSRTGEWTVQTENTTISSVTSSSRARGQAEDKNPTTSRSGSGKPPALPKQTRRPYTETASQESPDRLRSRSRSPRRTSTPAAKSLKRRRLGPGSRPGGSPEAARRRLPSSLTTAAASSSTSGRGRAGRRAGGQSWPSPEEVGRRHQQVPTTGLTRLARLQQEAWDPPILNIKGPANQIKCWRRRSTHKNTNNKLFLGMTTVFHWVIEDSLQSRLLVAFENKEQRERFLKVVHLPKGCTYAYGQLDSL